MIIKFTKFTITSINGHYREHKAGDVVQVRNSREYADGEITPRIACLLLQSKEAEVCHG